MKKKSICSIGFMLALLLTMCTSNNVYINRETDNAEGQAMLNRLYNAIGKKDFNIVEGMTSDSMKLVGGGQSGINHLLKFINIKAGNYKSYHIEDRYIKCITGSTNEASYNYKLKVTYEKGTIDEIVGFQKKNSSDIKLFSYHANSDLLIK